MLEPEPLRIPEKQRIDLVNYNVRVFEQPLKPSPGVKRREPLRYERYRLEYDYARGDQSEFRRQGIKSRAVVNVILGKRRKKAARICEYTLTHRTSPSP